VKRGNKIVTTMIISIMLATIVISSFNTRPVIAQTTVPRNETVWGAGFGMNTGSYQPWNMGANQAWTTYLMYEPMFGMNVATGEIIGWLGDSIEWQGDDVIQITLRSGLHWTSIGSSLVSNTSAITTDDVIFSFEILQQTGQLGSLVQRVGNVSTAFEKVSNTVLNVHILPSYAGSSEVYRQLTYGFLIFPKAVWSVINATYSGDLSTYTNDWQDSEMVPANYRVASGMYLPYYHDATSTIGVVNENWWGVDDTDFGRLPAPNYFGYTSYSSNDLALLAMEKGDLDWDGNYLAGLTEVKAEYPNIVTYFDDLPYFPDKSPVMLVPNHQNYPLNQTWLHKAMAAVLNYTAMSAVSSGYLKDPSPMLIPADDAAGRELLNSTLESQYAINYDVDYATSLLEMYCTFDDQTGTWWTKQGVTPSDPIKHYPLQEWNYATNTTAPYTILDFMGWTDVNAMDVVAAQAFSDLLHIQTQTELISGWGTVQVRMNNFQFDLANMVMSGQINMNMYERYFQMFSPDSSSAGGGVNAPLGGWYNQTFVDDIEALDTYPAGSAQQWAVANEMQKILGEEMPVIPLAGHADWQIYSTTYWKNWPNSVTNPMLPSSPFAGTTQNANLLAIVFGLEASGATPPPAPVDYTLIVVGVVVAIVVVAVVFVLYRRRSV
jgi:peptide/nickel transport system substrate-binding protein